MRLCLSCGSSIALDKGPCPVCDSPGSPPSEQLPRVVPDVSRRNGLRIGGVGGRGLGRPQHHVDRRHRRRRGRDLRREAGDSRRRGSQQCHPRGDGGPGAHPGHLRPGSQGPVAGQSCTDWAPQYTLVPDAAGTGYLIDNARPSAGSGHTAC